MQKLLNVWDITMQSSYVVLGCNRSNSSSFTVRNDSGGYSAVCVNGEFKCPIARYPNTYSTCKYMTGGGESYRVSQCSFSNAY